MAADAAARRVVKLATARDSDGLQRGDHDARRAPSSRATRTRRPGPSGPVPAIVRANRRKSGGPEGDEAEHGHHRRGLRQQVGVPGQRRGEVQPEHAVASVAAQQLGCDEGGEHDDRGGDIAVVVGVRRQHVGLGDEYLLEQDRDADEDDRGHVGDEHRQNRKNLGRRRAPQTERTLHAVCDRGCVLPRAGPSVGRRSAGSRGRGSARWCRSLVDLEKDVLESHGAVGEPAQGRAGHHQGIADDVVHPIGVGGPRRSRRGRRSSRSPSTSTVAPRSRSAWRELGGVDRPPRPGHRDRHR